MCVCACVSVCVCVCACVSVCVCVYLCKQPTFCSMYCPWAEEVKWLLKKAGVFQCFDIPLESRPTQYISTPTINHLSTLVPSQS